MKNQEIVKLQESIIGSIVDMNKVIKQIEISIESEPASPTLTMKIKALDNYKSLRDNMMQEAKSMEYAIIELENEIRVMERIEERKQRIEMQ